ncbi:hypothetical protein TrLO_g12415 [Triparma laevis f. longispina]|uniref:Aspartate aminotransferase n=1 Tax=Triparma laevis f. longispina TaxID=1714387 RepID=A0A9W7EIZ5_9STRA|nr:hypothetical protein TrLO_g12415 [Triparma laevis f. longispina]
MFSYARTIALRQPLIGARSFSAVLTSVPAGPPDAIIGLTDAYNSSTAPHKVNVGVGAYRDDSGKPYVLPVVKEAEARVVEKGLNKEYAGIAGIAGFVDRSLEFAYGKSSDALKSSRVKGVQTLSGTGGLRVWGEFWKKFGGDGILLPDPSWGNHTPIFKNSGLDVGTYRYFDYKNSKLNIDGMLEDLSKASPTCVLLHACAHNPTGCDPDMGQWKAVSDVIKEAGHYTFFDCAYQGFASGDAEKDAASIRMFVDEGHDMALVQSYSKNFGLYGERVGCLSVVGSDVENAANIVSQLKICIRPNYSNPPVHGARIVEEVLSDAKLEQEFRDQCKDMSERIILMRSLLRSTLEGLGSTKSWDHITSQIGMFCFSGLSAEQVDRLKVEFDIFCTRDGRISMAGVTQSNVEHLAASIHEVTK